MAEPRYQSSDIPNYTSYPAEPDESLYPDRSASMPEGVGLIGGNGTPMGQSRRENSLHEPARQIGGALGRIVHTVRTQQGKLAPKIEDVSLAASDVIDQARERVSSATQSAKDKASDIGDTVSAKANDLGDAAKDRAQQAMDALRMKRDELIDRVAGDAPGATAPERLANRAQESITEMRDDVRRVVNQYPLHVIAGFAAAGLALGILLRVGRERA